jgi:hypothetical protein
MTRVIRRLHSARLKSTMSRGITRLHRRATIVATRLRRTATEAIHRLRAASGVIRLRRVLNHAAAVVAAVVHRHIVAEVLRPPTVAEAVATVIRNRPRIPSTGSVLAPSLRI